MSTTYLSFSLVNHLWSFCCCKRSQSFETRCMRKLLCISYLTHKTNNCVWSKINFRVDPQELSGNYQETEACMVLSCHMPWQLFQNHPSGHLGEWRCHGWQRKCCMDNIKESTSLPLPEVLTMASSRKDWKRNSAESSLMFSLQPNQSRDWTEDFRCVYVEPLCSAGVVVAALGDDVEQKARQLCYRDVDLLLNNFSVTELNLTWYWSCIYFLCMNFGEVEMMSWQISVTP